VASVDASDQKDILAGFLDKAVAVTHAQQGSLFTVDKDGFLRLIGSKGIDYLQEGTRIPIDNAQFLKRVISEKKMLLVENIEQTPGIAQKNNPQYETPSFLILPIFRGPNEVTAVLNLHNKEAGEVFTADDAGALSMMQTEIRFTLENRELQAQLQASVSEMNHLYRSLVQAEKLAAVGSCIAGVAHELKNPLAVILQGTAYLTATVGADATLLDVVARIGTAAVRADNIVKGLLSFTRQVPIQPREADIRESMEESLRAVERELRAKKINVIRDFTPEVARVFVDVDQIKQVLINIITNAVEAMPAGGTLTVGIGNVPAGTGEGVAISITDTGEGMPASVLETVFDPFFTTKSFATNTGLGLSISKGIIDLHRGKISITSEASRGTTVTVVVPVGALVTP
jgi:signal transduction histidine kinase